MTTKLTTKAVGDDSDVSDVGHGGDVCPKSDSLSNARARASGLFHVNPVTWHGSGIRVIVVDLRKELMILVDGAPLDLNVELLRAQLELDDISELPVEGVAAEQDVELIGVLVGDELSEPAGTSPIANPEGASHFVKSTAPSSSSEFASSESPSL